MISAVAVKVRGQESGGGDREEPSEAESTNVKLGRPVMLGLV